MEIYYSDKYNKIKSTIEDIKEDIDNIKRKNEKTVMNMINSVTKLEKHDCSKNVNHNENHNYFSSTNFKSDKYTLEHVGRSERELRDIENRSTFKKDYTYISNTPDITSRSKMNHQNYTSTKSKKPNHYNLERQIVELQVMISELEKKNINLQDELREMYEQKIRNDEYKNTQEENVLNEVRNILNVTNNNDVLPSLKQLLEREKNFKYKEELVEKLSSLYLALIGNEKGAYVDLKTLWRWVKGLISEVKEIKEKKQVSQSIEKPERNLYKEFCDKLIEEYNLKDVRELIQFINNLLAKNSKNRKRVEKIKNLLLTGPVPSKNNSLYNY